MLARLNKALKLTAVEETGDVISSNTWSENLDDTGHYLVGRLLMSKNVRFDLFKDLMVAIFNPVKGMDIKAIENNRYLFRFNHIVDKNRALKGCPWSFEKNALILNEVDNTSNPLGVNLDWCAFYVQVHDLPIQKMTKEFAEYIGNRMGQFIDVEHMDDHKRWSSTLHIRVKIDLNKPIMQYMRIRSENNDVLTVSCTYERLSNFCYLCGVLGHLSKFCEQCYEPEFVDPGDDTPNGAWLRADPGFRSTARTHHSHRGETDQAPKETRSRPVIPTARRGVTIFDPVRTRKRSNILGENEGKSVSKSRDEYSASSHHIPQNIPINLAAESEDLQPYIQHPHPVIPYITPRMIPSHNYPPAIRQSDDPSRVIGTNHPKQTNPHAAIESPQGKLPTHANPTTPMHSSSHDLNTSNNIHTNPRDTLEPNHPPHTTNPRSTIYTDPTPMQTSLQPTTNITSMHTHNQALAPYQTLTTPPFPANTLSPLHLPGQLHLNPIYGAITHMSATNSLLPSHAPSNAPLLFNPSLPAEPPRKPRRKYIRRLSQPETVG
ncbi:hypothetical protein Salat_0205100 [Sesamum alatum]|uniref:CCHC-type domain-containing protein n=1 Tax=Sesamum alatum TaxID=300844 RepID=A0AAE1YZR5_9LAMI|nr:hypothetical protein Salat_0205100 [Sesamum alatum]